MKKNYLSILAIGAIGFSLAQAPNRSNIAGETAFQTTGKNESTVSQNFHQFITPKASGDTIWYENFGNGLAGNNSSAAPAWTTGGQNNIWTVTTQGPQGQFSNAATETIQSTTAANGFAMFDSDAAQPGQSSTFTDQIGWIESPAIDLSAYSEVSLHFQQAYRHCCAGGFLFRVQFSDNNFTSTPTTYTVNVPGIGANQFTGTDTRLVNIKSFLQSATDLTNVKMRFLFDGTGGTSHYFWSVDDVALIETYENNLNLLTREIGYGQFQYPAHIFPQHQLTEVTFSGRVQNDGLVANNNVRLEVNVTNNGAPVGTLTSQGTTLNAGAVDSLVTTSWLPTGAPGTEYDLTFMTTQDETEEFMLNTVREDILRITDTVFGVDNFTISGAFTNFSSQPGQPVKIGNVMEIMEDTWATSMSIFVMNRPSNVGQLVFGELRAWNDAAGDFIYLSETDPLEVVNNQLGTFVTMKLIEPVFLEAGTEILLLAGHFGSGSSSDPDMAIGMSRAVRGGLVFGYTAENNLVQLLEPRSILARLNLVFDLSNENIVTNNVKVSNAYPNPTTQTTSVDITLNNATELSYKVVDMAGKVMVQANKGMLSAGGHQITIDASTFASGMYYLNIQTAEGTTTKKIIVSK
jgi:hypothetical protein